MLEGYRYLASPYTDPDPLVRELRYQRVMEVVKTMLKNGVWVYSPILHFHELSKTWGMLPNDRFFYEHGHVMLYCAAGFDVLRLAGWSQSVGVKAELEMAIRLGKPIRYIETGDLDAAATVTINPDKP